MLGAVECFWYILVRNLRSVSYLKITVKLVNMRNRNDLCPRRHACIPKTRLLSCRDILSPKTVNLFSDSNLPVLNLTRVFGEKAMV